MVGPTEQLRQTHGLDTITRSYGDRLLHFLQSEVNFEFSAEVGNFDFGLSLKNDPTFKESLQHALRGYYGQITRQAREYVGEIVAALREQHGDPELKVVLLVDSVEQIRGIGMSD
ncbi:hypothetical protein JCM17961_18620 [Endothiovibrio diazotrophicus]